MSVAPSRYQRWGVLGRLSRSVITADENLSENIVTSGEITDAGNLKCIAE